MKLTELKKLVEKDEIRQIPGVRAPMQISGLIILTLIEVIERYEETIKVVLDDSGLTFDQSKIGNYAICKHALAFANQKLGVSDDH